MSSPKCAFAFSKQCLAWISRDSSSTATSSIAAVPGTYASADNASLFSWLRFYHCFFFKCKVRQYLQNGMMCTQAWAKDCARLKKTSMTKDIRKIQLLTITATSANCPTDTTPIMYWNNVPTCQGVEAPWLILRHCRASNFPLYANCYASISRWCLSRVHL